MKKKQAVVQCSKEKKGQLQSQWIELKSQFTKRPEKTLTIVLMIMDLVAKE